MGRRSCATGTGLRLQDSGHFREPHHTPEFWLRLERALPDYAARKRWLAENARAFEL